MEILPQQLRANRRRTVTDDEDRPMNHNWYNGHNHLMSFRIDQATWYKFLKVSRSNDRTVSGEFRMLVFEAIDVV